MADETEAKNNEPEQQVDWKAKYEAMRTHSREWEGKAKANQAAADELEKLKADSQTEQQRATERAERAEAELATYKAAEERARVVADVAGATGMPSDVVSLLNGRDADELAEQVERIKKLLPAYPTRTDDGGQKSAAAKKTNAERFAEAIGGFIN